MNDLFAFAIEEGLQKPVYLQYILLLSKHFLFVLRRSKEFSWDKALFIETYCI